MEILDFIYTSSSSGIQIPNRSFSCQARIGALVKGHSPLGTQGCRTTGSSGRAGGRRFGARHAAGAVLPTRWGDRGTGDLP